MLGGEIIATGYLQVQVSVGEQARPIAQAMVRLFQLDNDEVTYEDFFMTNEEGKTEEIPLLAPGIQIAQDEWSDACPYACYNVQVRADGFIMEEIQGVQIFAETRSLLNVEPIPTHTPSQERTLTIIPPHQLFKGEGRSNVSQGKQQEVQSVMAVQGRILSEVIIPNNITVHLGSPNNSSAENLTVPFLYYLKNVASSEIYPTWPYESLKANIYAQMSLALNRVYTEWYPSRGYPFNITNSTAYDQAFVKNRNIYDSVANIVDEVFGEYIQKRNFVEPYYAEYCDGRMVTCPGMKQWGTVDLANRGMKAFDILKYYYGDEIRIVSSNNFQDIKSSYPGTPLQVGSTGPSVALIQEELNAIAINYPNIPPVFPVDGVFGLSTKAAVQIFQRQFNLTPDGIVGQSTWYKLSYIYVAVRKLAELTSLGRIRNLYSGAWPGTVLRQGSKGVEVQLLQYYLSSISVFYKEIPTVSIDGRFGPSMERSVIAFQKRFGLAQDGIVGQATWNRIFEVYTSLEDQILPPTPIPPYPGTVIRLGDRGESVIQIQNALNVVSTRYPSVSIVGVDGVFGNATQRSVIAFQNQFNLVGDGLVGETTWNKLFETVNEIEQGRTNVAQNATSVMASADQQHELRNQINLVAAYYPQVPKIKQAKKLEFAPSIKAFQKMLGLKETGILDAQSKAVFHQMVNELRQL